MVKTGNNWFEIFISTDNGTLTLELCKSLKEAREDKKKLIEKGCNCPGDLHIDEWKDKGNPTLVRAIE
jgi:hypothetical protein